MIDLTSRIIQPQQSVSKVRWHPWRRLMQVVLGLVAIALPWTNMLHADVRRGSFSVLGYRASSGDGYAALLVLFLLVWCLVAVSYLYGRVWCGWACPQTLASDFSDSVKTRINKLLKPRISQARKHAASGIWMVVCLAAGLVTGVVLTSYWIDPMAALRAAYSPAAEPWPAVAVWGLAALVFVDQIWIRRKFCTDACPYGAFLQTVADQNTLAVRYLDERDDDCIRCGKCVTVCPTGIDIKKGVGQLGCIGCGECVDACNDVLGRRGVAGLIEYRYGVQVERITKTLPVAKRWGLWDSRRIGVLAVIPVTILLIVAHNHAQPPLQASMSTYGAGFVQAGMVHNQYVLSVTNGLMDDAAYSFSAMVDGHPADIRSIDAATVRAHNTGSITVDVAYPASRLKSSDGLPVIIRVFDNGHAVNVDTNFVQPNVSVAPR